VSGGGGCGKGLWVVGITRQHVYVLPGLMNAARFEQQNARTLLLLLAEISFTARENNAVFNAILPLHAQFGKLAKESHPRAVV
jgi:hypothetical protein